MNISRNTLFDSGWGRFVYQTPGSAPNVLGSSQQPETTKELVGETPQEMADKVAERVEGQLAGLSPDASLVIESKKSSWGNLGAEALRDLLVEDVKGPYPAIFTEFSSDGGYTWTVDDAHRFLMAWGDRFDSTGARYTDVEGYLEAAANRYITKELVAVTGAQVMVSRDMKGVVDNYASSTTRIRRSLEARGFEAAKMDAIEAAVDEAAEPLRVAVPRWLTAQIATGTVDREALAGQMTTLLSVDNFADVHGGVRQYKNYTQTVIVQEVMEMAEDLNLWDYLSPWDVLEQIGLSNPNVTLDAQGRPLNDDESFAKVMKDNFTTESSAADMSAAERRNFRSAYPVDPSTTNPSGVDMYDYLYDTVPGQITLKAGEAVRWTGVKMNFGAGLVTMPVGVMNGLKIKNVHVQQTDDGEVILLGQSANACGMVDGQPSASAGNYTEIRGVVGPDLLPPPERSADLKLNEQEKQNQAGVKAAPGADVFAAAEKEENAEMYADVEIDWGKQKGLIDQTLGLLEASEAEKAKIQDISTRVMEVLRDYLNPRLSAGLVGMVKQGVVAIKGWGDEAEWVGTDADGNKADNLNNSVRALTKALQGVQDYAQETYGEEVPAGAPAGTTAPVVFDAKEYFQELTSEVSRHRGDFDKNRFFDGKDAIKFVAVTATSVLGSWALGAREAVKNAAVHVTSKSRRKDIKEVRSYEREGMVEAQLEATAAQYAAGDAVADTLMGENTTLAQKQSAMEAYVDSLGEEGIEMSGEDIADIAERYYERYSQKREKRRGVLWPKDWAAISEEIYAEMNAEGVNVDLLDRAQFELALMWLEMRDQLNLMGERMYNKDVLGIRLKHNKYRSTSGLEMGRFKNFREQYINQPEKLFREGNFAALQEKIEAIRKVTTSLMETELYVSVNEEGWVDQHYVGKFKGNRVVAKWVEGTGKVQFFIVDRRGMVDHDKTRDKSDLLDEVKAQYTMQAEGLRLLHEPTVPTKVEGMMGRFSDTTEAALLDGVPEEDQQAKIVEFLEPFYEPLQEDGGWIAFLNRIPALEWPQTYALVQDHMEALENALRIRKKDDQYDVAAFGKWLAGFDQRMEDWDMVTRDRVGEAAVYRNAVEAGTDAATDQAEVYARVREYILPDVNRDRQPITYEQFKANAERLTNGGITGKSDTELREAYDALAEEDKLKMAEEINEGVQTFAQFLDNLERGLGLPVPEGAVQDALKDVFDAVYERDGDALVKAMQALDGADPYFANAIRNQEGILITDLRADWIAHHWDEVYLGGEPKEWAVNRGGVPGYFGTPLYDLREGNVSEYIMTDDNKVERAYTDVNGNAKTIDTIRMENGDITGEIYRRMTEYKVTYGDNREPNAPQYQGSTLEAIVYKMYTEEGIVGIKPEDVRKGMEESLAYVPHDQAITMLMDNMTTTEQAVMREALDQLNQEKTEGAYVWDVETTYRKRIDGVPHTVTETVTMMVLEGTTDKAVAPMTLNAQRVAVPDPIVMHDEILGPIEKEADIIIAPVRMYEQGQEIIQWFAEMPKNQQELIEAQFRQELANAGFTGENMTQEEILDLLEGSHEFLHIGQRVEYGQTVDVFTRTIQIVRGDETIEITVELTSSSLLNIMQQQTLLEGGVDTMGTIITSVLVSAGASALSTEMSDIKGKRGRNEDDSDKRGPQPTNGGSPLAPQ